QLGPAQRAVADDPGAQQRGQLSVAETGRQRVHIRVGSNDVLRVATVAVPAGVDRARAEVLAATAAVPARTVGSRQPRHPDPITFSEPCGPLTGLDDLADDLVPWRHVRSPRRQVTLG